MVYVGPALWGRPALRHQQLLRLRQLKMALVLPGSYFELPIDRARVYVKFPLVRHSLTILASANVKQRESFIVIVPICVAIRLLSCL
jgi:hypothetical protein